MKRLNSKSRPVVTILGGGDLASGAAHVLFSAGFPVVIVELPEPRMVRRAVCFAEAVYAGIFVVEGLEAKVVGEIGQLTEAKAAAGVRQFIPILVDSSPGYLVERLSFEPTEILIDARMLKQNLADMRSLAKVTVGLGPGFCAQQNVQYAVETMRGPSLGQLLESGATLPDTGVPGVQYGESSRRLLRAPKAGRFTASVPLGSLVVSGQEVGQVDGVPVCVAIPGRIRGLLHSGLAVHQGEKLGDCDPRGAAAVIDKISDKARIIGQACLKAVQQNLPVNLK